MRRQTLAHLSDLHLGDTPEHERAAAALVEALLAERVDHVVVTGDMTHRGTPDELARFHALFAPLADRLTWVPGNHDRVGPAAEALMDDDVEVAEAPGLFLVRVDSTAPHNRVFYRSHGELTPEQVEHIDALFDLAQANVLRVLLLHHHPLALPEESIGEWFATFMGWPHALELALGHQLLQRVHSRCDLVLHGHRHVPREQVLNSDATRPLRVYNAGSSTELGGFRLFTHVAGTLVDAPRWHRVAPARAPRRTRRDAPVRPGASSLA